MDAVAREAQLRGFEFAKAVTLVAEPFSVENGLLTPTFKVLGEGRSARVQRRLLVKEVEERFIKFKQQCLPNIYKQEENNRLVHYFSSSILSCMTEHNVIGTGGSRKVYRIAVGQPRGYVSVKRIWNNKKLDQNLEDEFSSEVQILGSISHSNIVKLLCFLSSNSSNLLVYEYMMHQSLDKWQHGKKRNPTDHGLVPLDWPRRLQILIGAAQGLCYMHHDYNFLYYKCKNRIY